MIAIFRRLLKMIKKDHQLFSGYEKSHPHFGRYLAIDAALSVSLILIGFQLISPLKVSSKSLESCGVTSISADKLINYAKSENRSAFWFGPVPGNMYSINVTRPGTTVITYLPTCLVPSAKKISQLTVKTYGNTADYMAGVHPLSKGSNMKSVADGEMTVEFDKTKLDREIITFKNLPEIVTVNYPTVQASQTLVKSAGNLKLVQ